MKSAFQRAQPKVIVYRDKKNFDRLSFKTELNQKLDQIDLKSYLSFENVFMELLDKYALKKKSEGQMITYGESQLWLV